MPQRQADVPNAEAFLLFAGAQSPEPRAQSPEPRAQSRGPRAEGRGPRAERAPIFLQRPSRRGPHPTLRTPDVSPTAAPSLRITWRLSEPSTQPARKRFSVRSTVLTAA